MERGFERDEWFEREEFVGRRLLVCCRIDR